MPNPFSAVGTRPWMRKTKAKKNANTTVEKAGELIIDDEGNLYGTNGVTQTKDLSPVVTQATADANYAPRSDLRAFAIFTPENYGAAADGVTDDTAAIQSAVNAANASGGGRVMFGPRDYVVTKPSIESSHFHAISLPSKVRLSGVRGKSRIVLPASVGTATAGNVFYALRIGTGTTGADDVTIEDLTFIGRNSTKGYGGGFGSQVAIGAMHNVTKTATSRRVRVRGCDFQDWQIAVRASKDGGDLAEDLVDRLNSQFSNWVVEDCTGDLFGNKVVEFHETNGGKITRNDFTRCADGPQAIFFARNIEISYNHVTYTNTGINVAAGSHDIDIVGNIVEADPSIVVASAQGALQLRSEPTTGRNYRVYNVRSRGNVYRDAYTTARNVFRLGTTSQPTSEEYDTLSFEGDSFDGNVPAYAIVNAGHTKLHNARFRNCRIRRVATVPFASSAVWDIAFENCDIFGPVSTFSGTGFRAVGCSFTNTPLVTADAAYTVLQSCTWPSTFTDLGASTSAANNVVIPPLPPSVDPMEYFGSVVSVFNADDLTGANGDNVTTWSPRSGGGETGPLTARTTTYPTLVTAAINGHKSVRNGSAARLYTASAWGVSRSQPMTVALVFKADADSGAAQNILAGLAAAQPRISVSATDRVEAGGSSAESRIDNGAAITYGTWHIVLVVFTASGTAMYFDSTTKRSQTASTNNALTGLSLFSTGSGNSPYLVGEIAYAAVSARESSESDAATIMSTLASRYGLGLT